MEHTERLVSIQALIPKDLKVKFKRKCADADGGMTAVLRTMIEDYVSEKAFSEGES